ncbi:MAG: methionine adenosyltransferase [Bacteroidales bacterium]|nr:methionine adenosyltransferase [Bacteroidales bacterium]
MSYLFTSESVSEGHPDKVADQISDAILDDFLRQDPEAKVACETFVSTGLVVIGGEVRSDAYVDIQEIARRVIRRIGYTKGEYMFDCSSCGILSAVHEQSADIRRGVCSEEQGAGDQGMMFGYACNETEQYMPLAPMLSHLTLMELAAIRREGRLMTYLRPDAKTQYTVEYGEDHKPIRIDTIVLSTQHDEPEEGVSDARMQQRIREDVKNILLPRVLSKLPDRIKALFGDDITLHVNPTGKFVIGGPHGDTGLTGRKIIVDSYGGCCAHGGGAFSGKDPSKVDRSAAYAARHIAKNMVAAGICDRISIQVSYAIGVAKPVSIYVDTFGTAKVNMGDSEIAARIGKEFDLRPAAIIANLKLKNPIYEPTASYGHFGRESYSKDGLEFFTWEKLDCVDKLRKEFGI